MFMKLNIKKKAVHFSLKLFNLKVQVGYFRGYFPIKMCTLELYSFFIQDLIKWDQHTYCRNKL